MIHSACITTMEGINMALPEQEMMRVKELLDDFCHRLTTDSVTLEYHIKGNRVTLIESRPLFVDPTVLNSVFVAQFEFNPEPQLWTLFWYDRRNRRQPYPTGRNRDTIEKLIAEVTHDPTGIFWD
ncbi:MAG: DUF3024 domain-containing protein [Desulfuromonadaceae bacterium]|nr:DUF3024 domain-containing protein [Desulfuromonadaceae bacterium]